MNTKAILFNGPCDTGKTKAIEHLRKKGWDLKGLSCKDPLHNATRAFFGLTEEVYFKIYENKVAKSIPNSLFKFSLDIVEVTLMEKILGRDRFGCTGGEITLSLREAMIYVSEILMKPRFGEQVFGQYRANLVEPNQIIVDDSTAAFEVDGTIQAQELYPLIDKIGNENILLIRVHREGFDFSGDSRRAIPDGICENTVDIYNVDEVGFYNRVEFEVDQFILDCNLRGVKVNYNL